MIRTLFFLLLFSITTVAKAEQQPWKLVGEAKFSVLFWDIYEAQLFNNTGVFSGVKPPLQLHLTYLIDIKGKDLAKETRNQWQKMNIYDLADEDWLNKMETVFPDITENDSLTFFFNLDKSASLHCNNQLIHQFKTSPQISKFLDIWLSDKTSHPKLKDKLTGAPKR